MKRAPKGVKVLTGERGGKYYIHPVSQRKIYLKKSAGFVPFVINTGAKTKAKTKPRPKLEKLEKPEKMGKTKTNNKDKKDEAEYEREIEEQEGEEEASKPKLEVKRFGDNCMHEYKVQRALGKGAWGSVDLVLDRDTRKRYALKRISLKEFKKKEGGEFVSPFSSFRREVYYNRLLEKNERLAYLRNHRLGKAGKAGRTNKLTKQSNKNNNKKMDGMRRVARRMIEAWICDHTGYIVYELVHGSLGKAEEIRRTSFYRRLRKHKPEYSVLESESVKLLTEWEIIEMFTLAYELGQMGIAHGDLHLDNFLIDRDLGFKTKHNDNRKNDNNEAEDDDDTGPIMYITDFGLSGDYGYKRELKQDPIALADGTKIKLTVQDTLPALGWARNSPDCADHVPLPTLAHGKKYQHDTLKQRNKVWNDWFSYCNMVQLEMSLLIGHCFVILHGSHDFASFVGVSEHLLPSYVRSTFISTCPELVKQFRAALKDLYKELGSGKSIASRVFQIEHLHRT